MSAPLIAISRTRQQIAQSEENDIHFSYLLAGQTDIQYGEDRSRILTGGIVVCDNSKPFEFSTHGETGLHKTLVVVLRDKDYYDAKLRDELLNGRRFALHRLAPLLRMT